jgi:crossover junction endodeoxyribonuclease RusA
VVEFFVQGDPQCKGSTRSFVVNGRAVTTNMAKNEKPWAQAVKWAAMEVRPPQPWEGPIRVGVEFVMPRTKGDRKKTGLWHPKRRDGDKLLRSVLDAITGVLFLDDGQVCVFSVLKRVANPDELSGARVWVSRIEENAKALRFVDVAL